MATIDELNAGFDALNLDLHHLVSHFVPSFFQGQAMAHLESAEGRAAILGAVGRVAAAIDKVRNKNG